MDSSKDSDEKAEDVPTKVYPLNNTSYTSFERFELAIEEFELAMVNKALARVFDAEKNHVIVKAKK